jgi:hypothetical protein
MVSNLLLIHAVHFNSLRLPEAEVVKGAADQCLCECEAATCKLFRLHARVWM